MPDFTKIDLLKFHKKKSRAKKIVATCLTIVFLILGTIFMSFKIFYESKKLNENMGFFQSLSHLVLSSDRDIAAGKENINILILGIGGPGHDGPYLTDTMLVASINKKTDKVAMISIPRDLLVNTYKFGKQKINALNAYAEAERAEAEQNSPAMWSASFYASPSTITRGLIFPRLNNWLMPWAALISMWSALFPTRFIRGFPTRRKPQP